MTEGDQRPNRWLADVIGIAWVIAAAAVVMAPALSRGWLLGPYDQLSQFGLSTRIHGIPYNTQISDLIWQSIPWTSLAWTQVHHGLLPLWNPYSGLGAPLAFNWQSATFSLPSLVGYLFPLRLAFTVQVLMTLVTAGTGMYVLGRVMRFGPLGAAMAATVFELSGAFMALLGWPIASVMSWAGWLFACAILVVRGQHRRGSIVAFAAVLALAMYAGQPDTLVVLIVALAVFVLVMIGVRARRFGASIARPALDVAVASLSGLGLAAPLLLPSAQISAGSIRGVGRHVEFPLLYLLNIIFQRFNGFTLNETTIYFSSSLRGGFNYVPTAVYVGVIAVVLAIVALITLRKRPAIVGFGVVAVVSGCLVYSPLVSLLNQIPLLGEVRWVRSVQVVAFALALLGGAGLDALVRSRGDHKVRNRLGAGFGGFALLLLVLWLFGRGDLSAVDAPIRARSFLWPAAEVVLGLAVFGFLVLADRWRGDVAEGVQPNPVLANPSRIAGVVLLAGSTALLIPQALVWWPSTNRTITPNHSEVALQRAVGTSIVGFGKSCWYPPSLGIPPNVNVMFGVHELDVYDPMTPQQLFTAWQDANGGDPRPPNLFGEVAPVSAFCPVIRSVAVARQFGVGFVLELPGKQGPPGSIFDRKVGNEGLYRIPGASVATISRLGSNGTLPPVNAPGKPLSVHYPNDQSWKLVTHASTPQVLRLRLTHVPGWHATIDGKPLTLLRYNRVMFQARIPAGTHTIELHYWPEAFSAGIFLAVLTIIALVLLMVFGRRLKHRLSRSAAHS